MIGTYIGTIVVSSILAYLATCFKNCYESKSKFHLNGILKKELKLFLILIISYNIAGILFLNFKSDKTELLKIFQYLFLWESTLLIAYIDLRKKKIPNIIILVAIGARILGMIFENIILKKSLIDMMIFSCGGLVAGGGFILFCMLLCRVFSKGKIGAGDMKLYAVVGFYVGIIGVVNIMFYSVFISAIVGLALIVIKKVESKTQIPMAPFVFLGLSIYLIVL